MGKLCRRLTTPHALLLISAVQLHQSQAHPLFHDSPEQFGSLAGVEDFTDTQTTTIIPCSTTSTSANVAYEIPDGQVHISAPTVAAPYPTTSDVSSTDLDASPSSPSGLSARSFFTTTSTVEIIVSSSTTLAEIAFIEASASISFSTSVPDSSLTTLTTSAVQTATESGPTNTGGTVVSSLESSITSLPFPTNASYSTGSLSLVDTATLGSLQPTATHAITMLSANDIFQPIATDAPPAQISQRSDHPVPRLNIQPQQQKLQTNKFYSSFYLGNQSNAVFTFPYSINWLRGSLIDDKDAQSQSWGIAISHIERADVQYATAKFDPNTGFRLDAGEWAFYANPLGRKSIILSASELVATSDNYPGLATESLEWGSVTANLFAVGWQTPTISFPVVQGSSFITGNYSWATPLLQSGIGFQNVTYVGAVVNNSTFKYTAQLMGDVPVTWLIYVTPDPVLSPDYAVNSFTLNGTTSIQGHSQFNGLIQVAKIPINLGSASDIESIYDRAAGAYASSVSISGTVQDEVGSYTLSWEKRGNQDQSLLMFALAHHLSSFSSDTAAYITDLKLMTTTKGQATAIIGDSWTLTEDHLPIDMDFAPWTPTNGRLRYLSEEARFSIYTAGVAELSQNMSEQANTHSFYYDGKALAKFASIVYVMHQMVGNQTVADTGLLELEAQFEFHINGKQLYPLVYESAWGGAVSDASYVTGNSGDDFGNTYYNDHHFHYGYFVYAAAVIGYLHPAWLDEGTNKAWVNTLVRDYANSITDDPYFPFSRSFDWYHGHSWAAGLFDSADGKNQESSSEDTMASYAIKMWGQVIGDVNMMARGNLMLAVQARSLQNYYLYDSENTVQPAEFAANKAAGILFENKIDHTTYFGALPEYIQGIHMIPIMPFSSLIRTSTLVQQEWDAYFANFTDGVQPYVNRIKTGWRGLVMANYAIVDPETSYGFFDDTNFDTNFLDGGASLTWYLAWSAALKTAGQS